MYDDKWRGLKTYMPVKDNQNITGSNRVKFEYYYIIQKMLSRKTNVETPAEFESLLEVLSLRGKIKLLVYGFHWNKIIHLPNNIIMCPIQYW